MSLMEVVDTREKIRKKNRTNNLRLILRLLKKHGQEGVTVQQMALACGVSERNIYRYLQELKQLGLQIESYKPYQPGITGCYYKLKAPQEKDISSEVLNLVSLNQALQDCYQVQDSILFMKKVILWRLAIRYGILVPLHW
ncbi:HTH domain-containing protein [Desulforamulus aeronauticus DSM 10349]|uniref:HTH domain-containing protein n=2 Tax=Desulforamulus aeronauticus TaxID=53343 RepID=A0A1M6S5Q7_9FIRM|nr:HTH domain-containing protein [Desulforamulus aeronauticus DSM 10349]